MSTPERERLSLPDRIPQLPARAPERRVSRHCDNCGSTEFRTNASVRWDKQAQEWRVEHVIDGLGICPDCDQFDHVETRDAEPPRHVDALTLIRWLMVRYGIGLPALAQRVEREAANIEPRRDYRLTPAALPALLDEIRGEQS